MEMNEFVEKLRKWLLENTEWELICDMDSTDHLYIQWNELSKNERMSWIGAYKSEAKEAFEEFAIKKCKVETKVIDEKLNLFNFPSWPHGNAMQIYKKKQCRAGCPRSRL